MIRMSLALLACIVLTMFVLGRDVDRPEGSDDPGTDVTQSSSDPTELAQPRGLALDDEAGAIARALTASAPAAIGAPAEGMQTANLETAPSALQLHAVTGNRVNIRSGPSTADPVVNQVVRDQRVEVLDQTRDGWMHIRVVDTGQEAYIFGRFLDPING